MSEEIKLKGQGKRRPASAIREKTKGEKLKPVSVL